MIMRYLQITFFLTCLLLIQLVPLTAEDFPKAECISGGGNYTDGSSYQADLSSLLTSFSNAQVEYGFYNSTVGEVNGIGLCWGNILSEDCRACLTYSTQDILRLCPYYKEAILYQDICMLRYSNRPIFGRQENQPPYILYNALNVRDIDSYREKRDSLLLKLRGKAASGGTLLKYAIGEAAADPDTIYALVGCTPDLDSQDCAACVGNLSGNASEYFRYKEGGTAMAPSCYFRFEKYLFHDLLLDVSPQSHLLLDAFQQFPANSPKSSPYYDAEDGKSNRKRNIVISVISAVVSVIIISCISVGIYLRRRKPKDENEINPTPEEAKDEAEDKILEMESLQFNLDSIRNATDNFSDSNKLGQGGFGAVYKGTLANGQDIAVKRLSRGSTQGELEFENEVLLVAKLQHRNLARLVGFCLEGTERLLVYEFVPNRSLDHFLFDPVRRFQLNWVRRYKIIVGIARGLLYLHEDSRLRIIHRDLKASNILLDKEMNPKISDFGIAKYFLLDQTQGDTKRIVGTYGYMPPEYAMYGNFSVKSDVYSFGVLILEIVNGQKVASFSNVENVEHLTNFAWRSWREGSASNLIDPSLNAGSRSEIMRCIHIGLLCVQENPDDRPTMASIVLMLYSNSLTLPFPRRPGFFINDKMNSSCSVINSFDNASLQMSINSTSITDLHSC